MRALLDTDTLDASAATADGGTEAMSTRRPKPRGRSFARGNKAAAKGEPRTVPLSVRLPMSTAEKLAGLAYGRGSRADVLIELIDEAMPDPAKTAG